MKKKLSIVGMIFGVALIFVGILTLSGALGGDPSYPSFATPPYDSGYAQFGGDYYTYSVNNSAEAASAARAAAYNIIDIAQFLTTFLGIMSILLGLAVGGCSGIVFVYSGTASAPAAPSAPTANNINYNASAFEAAERAGEEERAKQEATERAQENANCNANPEGAENTSQQATDKGENLNSAQGTPKSRTPGIYPESKIYKIDTCEIKKCDFCGNENIEGAHCEIIDDIGTRHKDMCSDCLANNASQIREK